MKTYTYNRPRLRKNYVGTPTTVKQGRTVTAVVSVFSNVDFQGDRVMPGAFTHSLRKWEMSGKKIPVIWAHEWADPFAIVGYVSSARETDEGLEVDMVLDETPFADQVLELIKSRRVDNYSFSYDVVRERKARDGATELIELDLIECGACLRGATARRTPLV